ncbi:MAG: ribbon-helix-helix domain-containing protein [Nanoarchaeota archaeon]|nr:ribbon-helix-helix domain-containing protein [Nanoarchaeota archaeon]
MVDAVVKIDEELLKKIEEFLKKNKFAYSSKKQVVNLAVIEFLKSNSLNKGKKGGK